MTWLGDWESFDFEALLALEPDLLVGLDLPDVPDTLWYIPEDLYPLVEEKIPTLGLRMQEGQPATALIDRVEELAAALGVNLEEPAIAADRAAFESAADAVRTAAGNTGELAVFVIAADTVSVYLADPAWFGDLRLFQDMGVNLVSPPEPDGRWQPVSWEQIGQFPADLYLVDARSGEIPPELAAIPTWSALPAVAAGQIAPWQAVYPYSRKAFTPILERLAEAIEATDPGIAN